MGNQLGQTVSFAASYEQKALWFLQQLAPDNAAYNVNRLLRLKGRLSPDRLAAAAAAVAARHSLAHITFAVEAGEVVQVIDDSAELRAVLLDTEHSSDAEAIARLQEAAARPFRLQSDQLIRVIVAKRSDAEWLLLVSAHHILLDPISVELVAQEIVQAYAQLHPSSGDADLASPGATQGASPVLSSRLLADALSAERPPVVYEENVRRQRQLLNGDEGKRLRRYWSEALAGELPVLNFPADFGRPPVQTFNGASVSFIVPQADADALRKLAADRDASVETLLLAAYETLLYRYTSQDELIVGVLQPGRGPETKRAIGNFVNPLPVRASISGAAPFTELLQRTHRTYAEALAHRDLPFSLLVDVLEPARDPSYPPLFQASYSYDLTDEATGYRLSHLPGVDIEAVDWEDKFARYDLSLAVTDNGKTLSGWTQFNTDLFQPATIRRFSVHFQRLLHAIAKTPDEAVSRLKLLDDSEIHRLVTEWNDTRAVYPERCIHELFEHRTARHPGKDAVVFDNSRLTYAELNERANRLAHYLRDIGAGPDKLIGIYLPRNLDLPVVLLGILKSGAAYVPLDPNYPRDRIAVTLDDARVHAIVTVSGLADDLPQTGARIIRYDTDRAEIDRQSTANPRSGVRPRHLAYVIYTSGSTGRPKGVAIEHRSTTRWIYAAQQLFEPERDFDGVLASTSICFDMSCFEFFVCLGSGGKTIIAENALYLPHLPAKNEVTLINTVPSAVAELVRTGGIPSSVRICNLGGEPLFGALLRKLFAGNPSVRKAYNLYGPTEDTTFSTYEVLYPGDQSSQGDPTIGRPIANTFVYILDDERQPVPEGVPGELYIGGDGLAREYLNNPELTAQKFVPNPFVAEPGARMYRTGDLARYLPDKRIQYFGRIDNQVKIRGFRIELGEIESVLLTHPAVSEAVVLAKGERERKRLVAYAEVKNNNATGKELREYIKSKLPDYMAPSLVIPLWKFPLNPNGKLNRLALPEPEQLALHNKPREQARNALERKLAQAWREVLRVDDVGVHDNFFEIGGDSLLSAQLVYVLAEQGVRVSARDIFQYQTIAELAEGIADNQFQ